MAMVASVAVAMAVDITASADWAVALAMEVSDMALAMEAMVMALAVEAMDMALASEARMEGNTETLMMLRWVEKNREDEEETSMTGVKSSERTEKSCSRDSQGYTM